MSNVVPISKRSKDSAVQFKKFGKYLKSEHYFIKANTKDLILFNSATLDEVTLNSIPIMFKTWDDTNCDANGITEYIKSSLELIFGQTFLPNGPRLVEEHGTRKCNTYRTFKPVTQAAVPSPLFFELFERLAPVEHERHMFLQWLSHMFQFPDQRPSWHVLLTSRSGTGKGFLFEAILSPLVIFAKDINNYDKLMGKFATVLDGHLLILLDDPKTTSDSTQTRMKSILSEETVVIEHKGLNAKSVKTYARIILASNEKSPLKLDEDERRWYALSFIEHKVECVETQEFLARLDAWLKLPDSLSIVYNFFMNYDLSEFNHKRVVQTPALKTMIGMRRNCLEDFLDEYLDNDPVFQFVDIQKAAMSGGYGNVNPAVMQSELVSRGYETRRIPMEDGSKRYYWRKEGMSNAEVVQKVGARSKFEFSN